jgi:hypothetical protein
MNTWRRRWGLVLMLAGAAAAPCWPPAAVRAQPSADQVLTDLRLSAADKQRVHNGEFVSADIPAVSERDLALAMAFVVTTSPDALARRVVAGDLVTADAQVRAHGAIKGSGSVADFAALTLTRDEAQALSGAEAGDALNLGASEIAAIAAARGGGPEAIRQQLHKMLLARYQAYRGSGLAGIASYDRGGGRTIDLAADLRKAAEASAGLKKYLPAFQAVLLGYPQATVPQMQERFFWVKSVIEDQPTYILAHVMAVSEGGARVLARRQFYVSTRYNGEQSVAGFLPVQGGTLVVFVTHAFTDQVAGFGGSLKRRIGSSMLGRKMKEIFEAGRKKVAR